MEGLAAQGLGGHGALGDVLEREADGVAGQGEGVGGVHPARSGLGLHPELVDREGLAGADDVAQVAEQQVAVGEVDHVEEGLADGRLLVEAGQVARPRG